MPEDYDGTPFPEGQSQEHSDNQDENIPDWMKEAGWETSSGTFDESKPVFDDLEDEEEIVPADIPSWLEEAAPEGFDFDAGLDPAETEAAESDPDAFIMEDFDLDEPEKPVQDAEPISEPEEKAAPEEGKFDIPSWLENLELDEDSQETAVAWLENMPEDLRATEEELKAAEDFSSSKSEPVEEPIDELAWMDDIASEPPLETEREPDELAALSEDLVASDLIPETSELKQIYDEEDIETYDSDAPPWLKELAEDEEEQPLPQQDMPSSPQDQTAEDSERSMLPDWLSDLSPERESSADEPEVEAADEIKAEPTASTEADIPDWLGEIEGGDSETTDAEQSAETLEWLDSLARDQSGQESPPPPSEESLPPELEETTPVLASEQEGVSPNDDTLNTQVPTWLSQIGDAEEEQDLGEDVSEPEAAPASDPDASSWLDQIGEDIPGEIDLPPTESERDVLNWLDSMGTETTPDQAEAIDDLRESFEVSAQKLDQDQPELETAKYLNGDQPMSADGDAVEAEIEETIEAAGPDFPVDSEEDDLPDWLSELSSDQDEGELSLEEAIRQTDRDLNDAELEFLSRSEEIQSDNSDWLSKLDDEGQILEEEPHAPPAETVEPDSILSGGILDRLREEGEVDHEALLDEEIPQWLENLKTEEDPQETAVLWLQEFIDKGDRANVHDEIKRYTDELDPGDSIPKWMEDLKNEEDPQTTAMLWLEKFSSDRSAPQTEDQPQQQDDSSDWLAELEREEAGQADAPPQGKPSDFEDSGEGWLSDLDIDEKLKSADSDLPEWTSEKGQKPAAEHEEEPSWMKATSPLEGDIHTDELAGEQKEVEIPAWLAGYGEGEEPPEGDLDSPAGQAEEENAPGSDQPPSGSEEYAWVAAEDAPRPQRTQLDINKAAISQLESILGISYQVAKGIVHYREKQGPYREFSDLLNVPEIMDEQTIEILKPEVFIGSVEEQEEPEPAPVREKAEIAPKPAPEKKVKPAASYLDTLEKARASLAEADLGAAVEYYAKLVKKKKYLEETIGDLLQATLDHPLEISLLKTLGDAYMQSDQLDEALEAYSKAEDLLA